MRRVRTLAGIASVDAQRDFSELDRANINLRLFRCLPLKLRL